MESLLLEMNSTQLLLRAEVLHLSVAENLPTPKTGDGIQRRVCLCPENLSNNRSCVRLKSTSTLTTEVHIAHRPPDCGWQGPVPA